MMIRFGPTCALVLLATHLGLAGATWRKARGPIMSASAIAG